MLQKEWQPVLANMLQYACLEKPFLDREAWQVMVYRITELDVTKATLSAQM